MPIKTVIQAIRTAIFYFFFIGQTALVAITIGIVAVVAGRTRFTWRLARYWCWSNIQLLRIITGLDTRVTGIENIPEGGCIIASKHQSDWDVFSLFPYTGRPAFIVKKELMRIPFFGAAARSLDCIEIDRRRGALAIPGMLQQAREALKRGCRIVIFPEGTRRAPLAPPDYRQGIVRMYTELNVPVVPVAVNAGLYWGRNSGIIWPGVAEAEILPAIQPGLPAQEFAARLKAAIEPRSEALTLEAIENGIERPIEGALAERLAAVRQDATPH
jgi:1-acyl-sn-glycerol-3-phosphate acyltransferase